MKKIFTTLLMICGVCALTHAQIKNKNDNQFGFDVGYNQAYLSASNSNQHTDFTSGFNVGLFADHYFSDRWSLKVKAIYDQKGWGEDVFTQATNAETETTTTEHIKFRLSYITVPVMANWHFGKTRNWYLNFGPYIGFLTSASQNYNNAAIKDAFTSVDGGLALGIGVKIPVSDKASFFIEYDGQGGGANVFKNSGGDSAQNGRSSFNIGLAF